jgi:peptidoglycan/xylan/chitin deacetylase (PgdA/CDA1 family)
MLHQEHRHHEETTSYDRPGAQADGPPAANVMPLLSDLYEQMRRRGKDVVFGRPVVAGSNALEVALTFDDGPNDPYTQQLLELLVRHRVRATFFLIGSFVRRRPEIVRAIRQHGHLLGNHTMTHPSLLWQKPARIREELAGCNSAIEDATGEAVEWFRPPFGARRRDVLRIAEECGLTPVTWNVTGYDWEATDPHALAARVRRGVQANQRRGRSSNILLHDGDHTQLGTDRSVTLAATRMLLEAWAGSALRLVTVDVCHRQGSEGPASR